MSNAKVRFMQNNQAAAGGSTITVSSAVSGFPGTNSVDTQRWKVWRPQGAFRVVSTNKTIYIDDGSNKTVTLTEATYTSGAALAAHVQTQLNASSTLWTCTYSVITGKFTIGRSSGTRNIRLTQTTNAAWSMLGYTGASDVTVGTGLAADVRRNHTSETWHVDLGVAKSIGAFVVTPAGGQDFLSSGSAVATLKASNANDFASPDLTVSLTADEAGIVSFFTPASYRYWQYEIIDATNVAGPAIDHAVIYLGDYVELATRNVDVGFQRRLIDPSEMTRSEGGSMFWRRRTKYWEYSSLNVDWLNGSDRQELERVIAELGTSTPLFVALDPDAVISENVRALTKYMTFASAPSVSHLRASFYQVAFDLVEVI